MQWYDIVMVAVLVLTTLFGAFKGMAWQIASLSSIFLSYFVALNFRGALAPLFGEQEPWNRFAAMLVLYLGTSLAIWVGFRFVSGVIDRIRLKEFDRQVGALFGLLKGAVFCVAITFFAVTLSEDLREPIMNSKSGQYIAAGINQAHAVMPEEVHDVLHPYIHRLDEKLNPNFQQDHALTEGEGGLLDTLFGEDEHAGHNHSGSSTIDGFAERLKGLVDEGSSNAENTLDRFRVDDTLKETQGLLDGATRLRESFQDGAQNVRQSFEEASRSTASQR